MVRGLAYQGLITIAHFPTADVNEQYLGDINRHFGVWHYPNRQTRHRSPCFDVQYTSNSFGARDVERSLRSSAARRGVVLGDSFVEGVGVSLDDRMSNIAERRSGIELLNFGVSGNFSSTQQWLLYRELAGNFDHSEIFIFMLPSNDFDDNDPSQFPANRYRPYLRPAENGEFEVYYRVRFEDRAKPTQLNKFRAFRRNLYNQVYLLNLIRQFGDFLEESDAGDLVTDMRRGDAPTSYDDFNKLDLDRLLFSYRQLIRNANGKKVSIFLIPRETDFQEFDQRGYSFKVVDALEDFAKTEPNVEVYDMLPYFVEYAKKHQLEREAFFHSCDGHWSPLGNTVAAEMLLEVLDGKDPSPIVLANRE